MENDNEFIVFLQKLCNMLRRKQIVDAVGEANLQAEYDMLRYYDEQEDDG